MADNAEDFPAFLQQDLWDICDGFLIPTEVRVEWYREPGAADGSVRVEVRSKENVGGSDFGNLVYELEGRMHALDLRPDESRCRKGQDPFTGFPFAEWVMFPVQARYPR